MNFLEKRIKIDILQNNADTWNQRLEANMNVTDNDECKARKDLMKEDKDQKEDVMLHMPTDMDDRVSGVASQTAQGYLSSHLSQSEHQSMNQPVTDQYKLLTKMRKNTEQMKELERAAHMKADINKDRVNYLWKKDHVDELEDKIAKKVNTCYRKQYETNKLYRKEMQNVQLGNLYKLNDVISEKEIYLRNKMTMRDNRISGGKAKKVD